MTLLHKFTDRKEVIIMYVVWVSVFPRHTYQFSSCNGAASARKEDQIANLGEQAISEGSAPIVEQISTRVTRSRTRTGPNAAESDKQRTSSGKKRKGFAEHEQTEETSVPAKKKKDKRQRLEGEKEPDTDPELERNSGTDNEHEDGVEDSFTVFEEQASGREIMDSVTKLHFAVNVLMHTTEIRTPPWQISRIRKLQGKEEDLNELFGQEGKRES